ncbi:hypothetical protein BA065_01050 [Nanoarchaeota archaeon NZ13-N]|nr:MAG: hypothetical protein BA065_01050 [Nanoarchaeota archaeon NZ13-N]
MHNKKVLEELYEKGFLISVDVEPILSSLNEDEIRNLIKKLEEEKVLVVDKNVLEKFLEKKEEKPEEVIIIDKKERYVGEEEELPIKIIKNIDIQKYEINVNTWISYFRHRINKIKKILREHLDMKDMHSLSDVPSGRQVSIAGLIYDKRITEKGVIFNLEDITGSIKVLVRKDVKNFDIIKDIPLDSVIGFRGKMGNGIFYADDVIFPDVPIRNETKKGNIDSYIVFTGDFQFGNEAFIREAFERFLDFLNGRYGNDKMKEISKKIGYVLIVGDNVDGVGIYGEQENELYAFSYEDQYKEFEKYLLSFPEHIKVVICPGNHDNVRLADPQPPLSKDLVPELKNLDNFYFISSPGYVKIDELTVLMYHGYTFDWFVSDIFYIRKKGGYENAQEIMKFMLMIRHLNPTHGSNPYIPYYNDDPLVIDLLPDIFHTGHIHRADYGVYRGIELFNSSTFQGLTKYQIEMGHKPEPGIVYLRNIKTGEVLSIDFINEKISRCHNK